MCPLARLNCFTHIRLWMTHNGDAMSYSLKMQPGRSKEMRNS